MDTHIDIWGGFRKEEKPATNVMEGVILSTESTTGWGLTGWFSRTHAHRPPKWQAWCALSRWKLRTPSALTDHGLPPSWSLHSKNHTHTNIKCALLLWLTFFVFVVGKMSKCFPSERLFFLIMGDHSLKTFNSIQLKSFPSSYYRQGIELRSVGEIQRLFTIFLRREINVRLINIGKTTMVDIKTLLQRACSRV